MAWSKEGWWNWQPWYLEMAGRDRCKFNVRVNNLIFFLSSRWLVKICHTKISCFSCIIENNYCNKYCFRHWRYREPNGYPTQMCLYAYVNGDYPAHRHFWGDVDCRIILQIHLWSRSSWSKGYIILQVLTRWSHKFSCKLTRLNFRYVLNVQNWHNHN